MDETVYFKTLVDNELTGLYKRDNMELATVKITELRNEQPDRVVEVISIGEWYDLVNRVMPDTDTW
ncbi:hypothetical protein BK133_00905 [Paenibacillus sp. FSL H8-0548]|uniref:hypothetical protein n=1 Tax=Paenibacillus sp. FSL H8-0548 TaxID=1920422 RepID=UPI00096C5141|nr:hypothetical protein [Paenibacillus sp. FSL H8-0548]OMF38793.1 hypothetical protein BK133_00905 [Paenibacillus sp. FSL H8-0548]